jgi:hypothetical protein
MKSKIVTASHVEWAQLDILFKEKEMIVLFFHLLIEPFFFTIGNLRSSIGQLAFIVNLDESNHNELIISVYYNLYKYYPFVLRCQLSRNVNSIALCLCEMMMDCSFGMQPRLSINPPLVSCLP